RAGEVVVDRLRNADDPQFVALLGRQLANLVRGVLGVVSADVEEIPDVVRLEDLEHALEVLLLLQLVAARSQGRPRGVLEGADLLLGLGRKVDEVLLQDAKDAVQAAVDLLDRLMVECLGDHAGDACVYDGSRTARLTDEYVSNEFSHVKREGRLSGQRGSKQAQPLQGTQIKSSDAPRTQGQRIATPRLEDARGPVLGRALE